MNVPNDIGQWTPERLETLVVIQSPDATPMEKYLAGLLLTTPVEVQELEAKIESLEGEIADNEIWTESARDDLEEEIHLHEQTQEKIDDMNAVFPEDVVTFFQEARNWQKNNKIWKTRLTEVSSECIKRENERNKFERSNIELKAENLALNLELEMLKSAGFVEEPNSL